MPFILGQKKESTQVFGDDGRARPATLIEVVPSVITQVKTTEKDGYEAVQLGYGRKSAKRIKKPQKGHLSKLPTSNLQHSTSIRWLREFRVEKPEGFKAGDAIAADVFSEGDRVKVSAVSKGKGFQGVVKRHGFKGGPRSHGQKHSEREGGSIGSTGPQKVLKGKKMPGRMGGRRVSVKNLEVLKIIPDQNLLVISGAIPGRRGTLVEITTVK